MNSLTKDPANSEQVWFPESLYNGWLADSLVLMTASLLFYHMTRVESLEMDYRIAAFFSIALILISIGIGAISLYPYYQRIGIVLDDEKDNTEQAKKERQYRLVYTIFGSVLVFIQFGIAIAIFVGTLKGKGKSKFKK